MKDPIKVEAVINAPLSKVWDYWNSTEHIPRWAFADESWGTKDAENELKTGGKFKTTMFAKDGSASFDFTGTYTVVNEHALIEYDMDKAENEDQSRHVKVEFIEVPGGTKIIETFDPENENSEEMQRSGWQSILDNFKKYVESN